MIQMRNFIKNMANAAKKEDLTLIVNSSYRDYASQEEVWNSYENAYGEKAQR